MIILGQLCLLISLVASGYSAFALLAGGLANSVRVLRSGLVGVVATFLALTAVVVVLGSALAAKDFRLAYVAQYSNHDLPWHYSLSALWVGQAGSLLLWAWLLAMMAMVFRFFPRQRLHFLRDPALGFVMGYLAFLLLIMVFHADPMQLSRAVPRDGIGLSPLLQHPSMLIHPPVVFVGYAAWAFPFALAAAALVTGQLDKNWIELARPWALFAWTVLGGGILLGAQWAYEELGWGGYWSWDPVENGSLIPWLTGTALIHGLMAWKHCGVLKKSTLGLSMATFGLCNFATFLTRSGVFSSVHAFSQSGIGWLFLGMMLTMILMGAGLLLHRRRYLTSSGLSSDWLSRETLVLLSTVLLTVLAAVIILGTVMSSLSTLTVGRTILVGAPFYNNVLIPVALIILAMTALAPLLRWRKPPTRPQKRAIGIASVTALLIVAAAWGFGERHPITLAIFGLGSLVPVSLAAAVWLDIGTHGGWSRWQMIVHKLRTKRPQYAGFVIHVGLACLATGVAASSWGTQRIEAVLQTGETFRWAQREIRYVRLDQRSQDDKVIVEAQLEISTSHHRPVSLAPARHLYLLHNEWTTEVAIHSAWRGDLYTILNSADEDGRVTLTLIDNPLMRWIWLGGGVMACGAVLAAWPVRRRVRSSAKRLPVSHTKSAQHRRSAA